MKVHRFIGDYPLKIGDLELTDKALVHQFAKVLRLKPGEKVILCDGRGLEARGEVLSMTNSSVRLKLDCPNPVESEPARQATLYCAVLKRENFEWVVQKATELGVLSIVPLITQRTIKQNLNLARLRKIAQEAAEQSGRGQVPSVIEPIGFAEALRLSQVNDVNYFFDLGGPRSVPEAKTRKIGLFIGPEGGWDPEENKKAQASDLSVVGLGPLTLRGETAAIVAVYSMLT